MNDFAGNKDIYGLFYTWYAVTDSRNICPTGWHVPLDAEWETLKAFLGGETVAGGELKEVGTTHWNDPNTGATNSTQFTAVGGGYRNLAGSFVSMGVSSPYWSSSDGVAPYGWGQRLFNADATMQRAGFDKPVGCVVTMPEESLIIYQNFRSFKLNN